MDDPYLLTLHTFTLRQLATAEQVRDITGGDLAEIETALEKGVAEKNLMAARGSYLITPQGRELLDRTYPEVYASLRAAEKVVAAYERFEAGVNKQVLKLTTDWQTIEVDGQRVPNDHSDPDYDAKIINKLGGVLDKTGTVLAPIVATQPLLGRFLDRLSSALLRAEGGETDYVSGVRVDSFHTVWFQMHEHLLRMMGRERPE